MMDQLTEEERELAAMVREFAETVVAPQSYEADRSHTLSMDVVAAMGDLGLFGLPFPEEYGGQGGDYMALGNRSIHRGPLLGTECLIGHGVNSAATA